MSKSKTNKELSMSEKREITKKRRAGAKRAQKALMPRINDILSGLERVTYDEAIIYIANSHEVIKTLAEISKKGERYLQEEGLSGKDAVWHGREFKILNRDDPALEYRFYRRQTPFILTDPEKTFKRIKKEYNVWANVTRESAKAFVAANESMSEDEVMEYYAKVEENIETELKKLEELLDDFDSFEVVVTNYADAKWYPAIYFKTAKGKFGNEYLLLDKPNILYVKEEQKREHRRGANIKEFLKTAKRAGRYIYFKKKEG